VTKAVSDQIGGGGMADEVIRFNGFPFLEKEDKEADHDASFEPSEYQPSSRCDADSSCARHEEGSDVYESIGYAFAGDQCVSQFSTMGATDR
jgi:hypothetical protein